MGEAAEKLPPEESVLKLPPLPKGDEELEHLDFAHDIRFTDRLGRSLMVGMTYNARSITGQVMRIAVQSNGVAYALVRIGGRGDSTGMNVVGGRFRKVLFFSNGMYGAVTE